MADFKHYVHPDTGEKHERVSTILNVLNKPGLNKWKVNMALKHIHDNAQAVVDSAGEGHPIITPAQVFQWCEEAKTVTDKIRDKAATDGTLVHEAVEQWCKVGVVDTRGMSEPVLNGFNAFLKWVEEVELEPVESEITVYGMGYAGTIDLIARLRGLLYLVDLKTSNSFRPEYIMQIAGYRHAYPKELDGMGVLRLGKETGKPYWKDYTDKYDRNLKKFLALRDYVTA